MAGVGVSLPPFISREGVGVGGVGLRLGATLASMPFGPGFVFMLGCVGVICRRHLRDHSYLAGWLADCHSYSVVVRRRVPVTLSTGNMTMK